LVTWARLLINSVSFLFMGLPTSDIRSNQGSQKKPLSYFAAFRQAPPKIKMEICIYGNGRDSCPDIDSYARVNHAACD